jgi:hypothetical protein
MKTKNMNQLNQMLLRQAQKAMNVVSEKTLSDMYEETADFYTGGEPDKYIRTGALGDTPKTSPLNTVGNEVSFNAYLDTNHTYTTGKNPTMLDVLNLANNGITSSSVGNLRPTVGKKEFWERAEEKIEEDLKNTMGAFFN